MQIIRKEMPDDFNIFDMGDTHIGSAAFAEEGFNEFIDKITSYYGGIPPSKNYFIFKGDAIEGMSVDDPRYDPTDEPKIKFPAKQIDEVVKLFTPIKKRGVAWLFGNHEWRLRRFDDVGERLSVTLGIPYGTFACKIFYIDKDGKEIFKHFCTHGKKTINSTDPDPKRRREAMENTLKRQLTLLAPDCLIVTKGHAHKIIVCPTEETMYVDGNDEKLTAHYMYPSKQWFTCSGSFLKTYVLGRSTYSERGEYPPVELGCVVVKIRDRQVAGIDKLILGV